MEAPPRGYQDTDFWLDIDSVVIGPEIGKGQFSTVYAGKYFGDLVAVKKQIRKQVTIEAYILRELSVLKVASHVNLVQYIGASNNPSIDGSGLSASYIVTELCVGGDLLRLLLNRDVEVAWKIRIRIAMQVADAIRFLHSKGIVHRDIKSSNILLDEEWNCKLSDFGLARFMETSNSQENTPAQSWSSADLATSYNSCDHNNNHIVYSTGSRKLTICGTNEYMPPEMLFNEDYTCSVDIFSFGMVVFEIMTREQIGENGLLVRKPEEKFKINLDKVPPHLPPNVPASMYTLATQCTDYDPTLRPDAEQTVDWIRDVYEQDSSTDVSAVPSPQTTRPRSIQVAMAALVTHEPESGGGGGGAGGLPSGATATPFSPQPEPAKRPSFTSPSGVFKSLFHTKSTHSMELSSALDTPTPPAVQLTAEEFLLTEKYLLREPENNFFAAIAFESPNRPEETSSVVLKEGMLYKINETGFRNWKQIHCTLTETKLTYKYVSDPSRTNVFLLKDSSVRRTRDKRFMLSQKVVMAAKTPAKRAPTPDVSRQHRAPSDSSSASSAVAGIASIGVSGLTVSVPSSSSSTSAHPTGVPASSSSSSGSNSNPNPTPGPTYVSTVQRELAAKSAEDMDDWVDAILNAINEQKFGTGEECEGTVCSAPVDQDALIPKPMEEFETVDQWIRSTGLSETYCTQYLAILEERGYDSVELIANVGLKDSDFDYLGIDNPAHRRALSNSICSPYSSRLKLSISSFTKYDSTVLFKVTSRWQYQRSCIQIQSGHFKRLDKLLRRTLQAHQSTQALLQSLPVLPSDLNVRHRAEGVDSQLQGHSRRLRLQLYLMHLTEVLTDTPHFKLLLNFLELLP